MSIPLIPTLSALCQCYRRLKKTIDSLMKAKSQEVAEVYDLKAIGFLECLLELRQIKLKAYRAAIHELTVLMYLKEQHQ